MYPRRFKAQHNPVDFGLLVKAIIDNGWTYEAIEEATGISKSVLMRVSRDCQAPKKEWEKIFALLDLFVRATHNAPMPLIK